MSTRSLLLFALVSSVTCAPGGNDSSVNFMLEYFKTFNHAVATKDLTTLPALIEDGFVLQPCNGTRLAKPLQKEDFLDAVMDLPDNTSPIIEIQQSDYCNEKNPSIFCIRMRLMITGFGGRFDVESWYEHPTWRGGETGRCNPEYLSERKSKN